MGRRGGGGGGGVRGLKMGGGRIGDMREEGGLGVYEGGGRIGGEDGRGDDWWYEGGGRIGGMREDWEERASSQYYSSFHCTGSEQIGA